jgi:hypothetical protein
LRLLKRGSYLLDVTPLCVDGALPAEKTPFSTQCVQLVSILIFCKCWVVSIIIIYFESEFVIVTI